MCKLDVYYFTKIIVYDAYLVVFAGYICVCKKKKLPLQRKMRKYAL